MTEINKLITNNIAVWSSAVQAKRATGRGTSKKIRFVGIESLRNLIVELALQGKLTHQETSDTPSKQLVEKVNAKRAQLIKNKLLKKQKSKVSFEPTTKPYSIPSNWCWSSIGELCELAPKNELADECEVSFIPMPLISTSYSGSHGHELKKWAEVRKGFTQFADGDIGLAKITPCFENSKAAVFSGLKNGVGSGTTELHVARPLIKEINPRYLLLFLKSPLFLRVGESKMTGSAGQKRVPKDFFSTFSLPLAPEEEQSRIVAKVSELMSLCDQLEQQTEASIDAHQVLVEELLTTLTNSQNAQDFQQNWTRIAEHFDLLFTTEHSIEQLKKTILQLAVMGKLVPQDPTDEPASDLLKKIAQEKEQLIKDKVIKKQKTLPVISNEEMPFDLPKSWKWARLGEIGITSTGKTPSTKVPEYFGGDIPFIGPGQISPSGQLLQEDKTLTEEGLTQSVTANANDLLMVCIGGSIGKSTLANKAIGFNQQINAVSPLRIDPHYLHIAVSTDSFYSSVISKASGSATPIINRSKWEELLVPVAPLAEQTRIISKTNDLIALCEGIKHGLNNAGDIKVKLASSIVGSALS